MAGLTLGGGIGWIMRKLRLTIDKLLSVDVVTADGEWSGQRGGERRAVLGCPGGGGDFGIVTEFEFRLNPLGPEVWPARSSGRWTAPSVLRFYRDWVADCPDELTTIVVQRRAPDLPVVPPDLVGQARHCRVAC